MSRSGPRSSTAVALVGHPIHVMMVHARHPAVGGELLARLAGMTLVAITGANWGERLVSPDLILPHGLAPLVLTSVMTGFAGWHGGKLVLDHGVGVLVTPKI